MPILTGRLSPYGPIIDLKVMQSPQRVAALKQGNQSFSSPVVIQGLLDTGADGFALDNNIIKMLGLESRGVTNVHTPSTGPAFEIRNQYDACVVLGENQLKPLVVVLPAVACDFASQGFLALIGRDVLRHCIFRCDGPMDVFSLSF